MKKFMSVLLGLGFILTLSSCDFAKVNIMKGLVEKTNRLNGVVLSDTSYVEDNILNVVFDEFYLKNVRHFQNDIAYALNNGIKDVKIRMANFGGPILCLFHMIDVVEYAQKQGMKFTAVAELGVMSAAVPLFVSCDVRIISKSTLFMLHPIQGMPEINSNADTVEQKRDWESQYSEIVAKNTKLSKEFVLACMRTTHFVKQWYCKDEEKVNDKCPDKEQIDENAMFWFSSEEALNLGMADKIGYWF